MPGKRVFSLLLLTALVAGPWCPPVVDGEQTGFTVPRTAPLYQAPPWEYRDNRAIVIVFETTPDILTELVPEPLVPHALNYAFAYIGRYNLESPSKLTYHEAGIGIPSSYETTQGKFAAFIYSDKVMPLAAGREIWGSPKKDAVIQFKEDGKRVTATVSRGGRAVMRATLSKDRKLDPKMGWPEAPWFSLKLVPSVEKDARPAVMQITSTTVRDRFKELYAGKATLEFDSTPDDPLGKMKVLGLVSAQFAVYDFDIGYGEILHDYLAEAERRR
ncbi:MAG: acetoacetate decarboxylase family protein [Desulfomonilaceae bacterium]|nr:acetoacetate decarboxylase family protein [Desulfomonilaceae bacterium]